MNATKFHTVLVLITIVAWWPVRATTAAEMQSLTSIDTGLTISKVRTAIQDGQSYIVASSYEGTVLGIGFDGTIHWRNPLSGFMNRDLWCDDITGDGDDEILAANADGTVYCLNGSGELRWKFSANDAPMNAVCVISQDNEPHVVCGGYDSNIYYLSAGGRLEKGIPSSNYSQEKSWGNDYRRRPKSGVHTANFIRPIKRAGQVTALAVHGVVNSNAASGSIYLFEPLAEKPFSIIDITGRGTFGEFRVCDSNGDGNEEILLGTSGTHDAAGIVHVDPNSEDQAKFDIRPLLRKIDRFGYRVEQPELISDGDHARYFVLLGSHILLIPLDFNADNTEIVKCRYSFNDVWKDSLGDSLVLASAQSGGSCVHILNLSNTNWKREYEELTPPGKIATILRATAVARDALPKFRRPAWEREPLSVYFMTERIAEESVRDVVDDIQSNYSSPIFLNGFHQAKVEDWDRSAMANEKYRQKRDRRKTYSLTAEEALKNIVPKLEGYPGIAYWGGHGNDPYMYSPATTRKVIDAAAGKKVVLIYPELEDHSEDFAFVLNDLLYPLAEYGRERNLNLYIRTKHTFWQSGVYLPDWSKLIAGDYANVFVPSMEETTDKSMELSLVSRMGLWASGSVNSWGSRCARDNASFDRLRQHSHQMLPNHFLRVMIYHIASGSQYINNFPVDQKYMSFLWQLIAEGALYVPKRSEIVSFSPVHISMTTPDEDFINEGSNAKWTTFYDPTFDEQTLFVFGRLNGTWPGAPVTQWDFSRYAAGVGDRRLNFLPTYKNGLVLITPPQHGVFAESDAPRGSIADHIHPLYQDILQEYITDGRHYYSADGKEKYPPDQYYSTIEADIQKRSKLLPLTVSGNVAWVVAQTSPTHLRLTLVDGGYINPKTNIATVEFHTTRPVKMIDLLFDNAFDISDSSAVKIKVPCGMFRFIDIELDRPL